MARQRNFSVSRVGSLQLKQKETVVGITESSDLREDCVEFVGIQKAFE